MSNDWISPVKINDSTILGCSLSVDPTVEYNTASLHIAVGVNFEHAQHDETMICKCILKVSAESFSVDVEDPNALDIDESTEKQVARVACKIGIIISIDSHCFGNDSDEDENEEYLEANAISLGFGKARAFIEEITSQSSLDKLTLPAISPYDVLAQAKQETSDN